MGEVHEQSDESYFDKDFYCDICSRWFDKENNLTRHKKEHQKEQLPLKITDSEKLYCNFCEETFVTKRDLTKHKKKVHSEKVVTCCCWDL